MDQACGAAGAYRFSRRILRMTRAIVIFGATGDLALRMLYPSLYFLEADGLLPADLKVVGA